MINVILDGLVTGGGYSLIALGLSLIFGVLKVINFAHGSLLMIGMYITYWLFTLLGVNPYLASIVSVPVLFLLGYCLQDYLLFPLFKRETAAVVEPISALIMTCGIWLLLDNLALLFFKSDYRAIVLESFSRILSVGPLYVNTAKLISFLAALVCTFILSSFLKYTSSGQAIRAISQDREAALLQGINMRKMYALTFGIGASIVGLAGSFLLPYYYVHPSVGSVFVTKAFIIVVLGGMGSIWGAMLGGLVVGIIEAIAGHLMRSTLALLILFLIFIVTLLFKPSGILGRES